MSVTLRQFFIGIKKSVSIHNIYKTQFFLFVNSITTQQFNNHRTIQYNHTSSSMTTHLFIERKLHVAAKKIATA